MAPSRDERWPRAAIVLVLAVAVAFGLLRLLWLDADPPGYILDEFITDEGWYAQSARNHALFGQWVMDEHNVPLVLCPGHTLGLRASYSAFGVSFWSTRIVGALASALTVLVVGWGLRATPVAATIAATIVATHPILFSLARVAYCESLQLLFVTIAWALASDERRRPAAWLAAGAAGSLAVLAKASALYAPAFVLAAPILRGGAGSRRQTAKETTLVAAGLAMPAVAIAPFLLPFVDLFWVEQAREGSVLWRGVGAPAGLALPLAIGLHHTTGVLPGFWVGLFPLLTAFGLSAARLLRDSPAATGTRAGARIAAAWLVLSMGLLCLRKAAATQERYWANMLVPLACLTALAWARRSEARQSLLRSSHWLALAFVAVGPMLLARQLSLEFLKQVSGGPDPVLSRVRVVGPVSLLALAFCVVLLSRRGRGQRLAHPAVVRTATVAAIAIGATSILASMYGSTHTLRDASRALRKSPSPRVMTGDLANTLALETPFWAFVFRDLQATEHGIGWINGDWRALGATHWVSDRPPGEKGLRTPTPAEAVLESSYPVWPDGSGQARLTVYVSVLRSAGARESPPR